MGIEMTLNAMHENEKYIMSKIKETTLSTKTSLFLTKIATF